MKLYKHTFSFFRYEYNVFFIIIIFSDVVGLFLPLSKTRGEVNFSSFVYRFQLRLTITYLKLIEFVHFTLVGRNIGRSTIEMSLEPMSDFILTNDAQ